MGYESRLIIVQKSDLGREGDGKRWAEVIAELNMCCMGDGPYEKLKNESPVTDCYIYMSDGNTRIDKDAYGKELKEMELEEVLAALQEEGFEYRRIQPAYDFIKAILNSGQWDLNRVVVLHYGY